MAKSKKKRKFPKPSEAELRILNVLWQSGPSTVREVFEQLEPVTHVGYTTILKLMQIMHDKGLAERDERSRSHIYSPTVPCGDVQELLVDDLVTNAFGGSKKRLVMQILENANASPDEMAEIRRLLQHIDQHQDRRTRP